MKKIILASKSPRRKELLEKIGYDFSIYSKETKEVINEEETPLENVKRLALEKAQAVKEEYPNNIVIGSDTVVVYDNKIYGKPLDSIDALNTLNLFSGKTHEVMTGVAVIYGDKVYNYVEVSEVSFRELRESEILNYIQTKEPLDKAGSYAIQGEAGKFVKNYTGEIETIIGLPLKKLDEILKEMIGE